MECLLHRNNNNGSSVCYVLVASNIALEATKLPHHKHFIRYNCIKSLNIEVIHCFVIVQYGGETRYVENRTILIGQNKFG